MKKKVVIVGGGINGLTAANYLQKQNFDVHILEKNNHINREQITTLKKRKLKLKDKQASLERESVKQAKQLQFALAAGS